MATKLAKDLVAGDKLVDVSGNVMTVRDVVPGFAAFSKGEKTERSVLVTMSDGGWEQMPKSAECTLA